MTAALTPLTIRGTGALSAAGFGVASLFEAVLAGRPLALPVDRYDVGMLSTRRAALVPESATSVLATRWPHADRSVKYALSAIDEALSQAPLRGKRVGLFVGTSVGGVHAWAAWNERRLRGDASPVPECATHADTARLLARELGGFSAVMTVSTACTSSSAALMHAADALWDGALDEAVVVGVDVLCPFVHVGFERLGALASDDTPPNPFGAERRGMWLGEGAAAVVLSREGEGAVHYLGGATASDAVHMTAPARDGRGLVRASRDALRQAGAAAREVDWVSAHATSTPFNDAMEAAGLAALFGADGPVVHAAKPVTGHTLGASGLMEAVIACRVLESGVCPPTFSYGARDEACASVSLDEKAVSRDVRTILSINSAMAGHNSAIVLGRRV